MFLMNRKWAMVALVLGVVFLGLAIFYWITPASALPSFFPGYDPAMAGVHVKHGIAAFGLGILCFVYAWFATGKKKSS
jgi:hypothetical protein